jgi:hypothetical protein
MSRFLHRPMFRRGGSTGGGITSGLTRQGYEGTNDPADQRVKPKDSSRSDFLINFGLDLATRSPKGNILQTAAASMREPFKQFQAATTAQEARDYQRQMYDEKMALEKEKFGEEKRQFGLELEQDWKIAELEAQGEKQFIEEQINNYWDPLIEAELDLEKKKILENEKAADKYNVIVMGADISDKYKILSNAEAMELAADRAENEIRNTKNKTTGLVWAESDPGYDEFYQSLVNKYMRLATKFLEEGEELKASGGRVGRALGGGMTEDVNVMTETPGGIADINIAERTSGTTNEINISYEQLRDRLPQEISNEIVLLLSESYEAFADFAELQTQADVNEFNTKYNVQLFLPQQSGA